VLAHRNHRRVALVGRFTVPSALVHGEQADPSRLTTFSTVDSANRYLPLGSLSSGTLQARMPITLARRCFRCAGRVRAR
jgi:hypothetical protein